MLARSKLIPLKSEFELIRKNGKLYDAPTFGLIVAFSKQKVEASAQAAFIVSKKIDKSSVVRHDIKRKLAHVAGLVLARVPKNAQLVFLAKQSAKSATQEEIVKELETCLKRAQLL